MLAASIIFMLAGLICAWFVGHANKDHENITLFFCSLFFVLLGFAPALEVNRGKTTGIDQIDEDVIYRYWGGAKLPNGGMAIIISDPSGDLTCVSCKEDRVAASSGQLVQMSGERLRAVPERPELQDKK